MRIRPLCTTISIATILGNASSSSSHQSLRRPPLRQEIKCLVLRKYIQYGPGATEHGPDDAWDCELLDDSTGRILTLEGLDNLDTSEIVDKFISGVSEITIPGGIVGETSIFIPPTARIRVDNTNNMDRILLSEESYNSTWEDQTRKLMQGDRKVLAVHIIDQAGVSTTFTPREMSDMIFGSKRNNLVTQFKACSYNKLRFAPTTSLNGKDPPLAATGVYQVRIPVSVAGMNHNLVREEVSRQLRREWKDTILPVKYSRHQPGDSSPFDHIMFCIPPGTDEDWLTYGYENSWLTVYNDKWCNRLSAQMHELGHNIAAHHAGDHSSTTEIGLIYGDQSGVMGSLYRQENGPLMCFNSAKSWKLGWYEDKAVLVSPFTSSWSGRIGGISDYANPATKTVLLKIETETNTDFFLNFNRKAGINKGTREGANQVLVTQEGTNGVGYGISSLMAKLSSGQTYTILNFGGSGRSVRIKVDEIKLNSSPAYADVTVEMGCTADSHCQQDGVFACTSICDPTTSTCETKAGCNCDGTCNAQTENLQQCPSDCGEPLVLDTTRDSDNGHAGLMFDIRAKHEVQITGLQINAQDQGTYINAYVYTKEGGYNGFQNTMAVWKHIHTARIKSEGEGELTKLPNFPNPIVVPAGGRQSFYVTLDTDRMRYRNGQNEGALFASDDNIEFFEGIGKSYPFGDTHSARIWSGRIKYVRAVVSATPQNVPTGEKKRQKRRKKQQNKPRRRKKKRWTIWW